MMFREIRQPGSNVFAFRTPKGVIGIVKVECQDLRKLNRLKHPREGEFNNPSEVAEFAFICELSHQEYTTAIRLL